MGGWNKKSIILAFVFCLLLVGATAAIEFYENVDMFQYNITNASAIEITNGSSGHEWIIYANATGLVITGG